MAHYNKVIPVLSSISFKWYEVLNMHANMPTPFPLSLEQRHYGYLSLLGLGHLLLQTIDHFPGSRGL